MSLVGAPPAAAAVLLFAALVGFAAWRARLALLPDWTGAPARLAEVVLALSLALLVAEALGLAGLLRGLALEVGAGLVALAAWAATRRVRAVGGDAGVGASWPELAAAAVLVFLLLAIWLLGALRVLDGGAMAFDSTWYHLPIAGGFARSGSIAAIQPIDPITLARFYPADSELVHSIGIAILHRDVLSPLLNVGWMALGLLAGWCIGRPFRAAPLSLLAVAVALAAHCLSASQPGSATNDVVATAALLGAAAILVNGFGAGRDRGHVAVPLGAVLVAGLAAGIAAGTKLNLLLPIAVLTVGVVAVAAPGTRRRVSSAWLGGALATGALWYVRNLLVTGSPLPWLHSIGPIDLPSPDQAAGLRPGFTVAHYLTDTGVWSHYFFSGLRVELGDLWPLLLALGLAGMIVSLWRPSAPIVRALGACALAGALAYVLTPLSAGGPEGHPVVFATNLRWAFPFGALGLALLPTAPLAARPRARAVLAGLLLLVLVANLDLGSWFDDSNLAAAIVIALALSAAWLGIVASSRRGGPRWAVPAAAAAALAIAAAAAYAPRADDYLRDRFRAAPPGSDLGAAFRWARHVDGARVALAGTSAAFDQYPLYGDDDSNDVRYVARAGPHGALVPIHACRAWRAAVDDGHFDYLVTAGSFNPRRPSRPRPAPERSWAEPGAGSRTVLRDGQVAVFRIRGRLDPAACA